MVLSDIFGFLGLFTIIVCVNLLLRKATEKRPYKQSSKPAERKTEIEILNDKLRSEWSRFDNLNADDVKEIENTLNMIKAYEDQYTIMLRRAKA